MPGFVLSTSCIMSFHSYKDLLGIEMSQDMNQDNVAYRTIKFKINYTITQSGNKKKTTFST